MRDIKRVSRYFLNYDINWYKEITNVRMDSDDEDGDFVAWEDYHSLLDKYEELKLRMGGLEK